MEIDQHNLGTEGSARREEQEGYGSGTIFFI